jgi:hypothetical protein
LIVLLLLLLLLLFASDFNNKNIVASQETGAQLDKGKEGNYKKLKLKPKTIIEIEIPN